jgi:hypothetical protein
MIPNRFQQMVLMEPFDTDLACALWINLLAKWQLADHNPYLPKRGMLKAFMVRKKIRTDYL